MDSDFQEWLDHRGIDCQALTAEMRGALVSQFEAEQPDAKTVVMPASVVLTDDELWGVCARAGA